MTSPDSIKSDLPWGQSGHARKLTYARNDPCCTLPEDSTRLHENFLSREDRAHLRSAHNTKGSDQTRKITYSRTPAASFGETPAKRTIASPQEACHGSLFGESFGYFGFFPWHLSTLPVQLGNAIAQPMSLLKSVTYVLKLHSSGIRACSAGEMHRSVAGKGIRSTGPFAHFWILKSETLSPHFLRICLALTRKSVRESVSMNQKQLLRHIEDRLAKAPVCELNTLSVLDALGLKLKPESFSEYEGSTVICDEDIKRFSERSGLRVQQRDYGFQIRFWKQWSSRMAFIHR